MITQKINSLLYDQRKMKVYQRHLTTVTTENYVLSSLWRKRKKEIGLNSLSVAMKIYETF